MCDVTARSASRKITHKNMYVRHCVGMHIVCICANILRQFQMNNITGLTDHPHYILMSLVVSLFLFFG